MTSTHATAAARLDMADDMFSEYPDLLTIESVQTALSVGRSTAYRFIRNGAIKHLRICKAIRVPKCHLVDFVLSSCYTNEATTRRQARISYNKQICYNS